MELFNNKIVLFMIIMILCVSILVLLGMVADKNQTIDEMTKSLDEMALYNTEQYQENQIVYDELYKMIEENNRLRSIDATNPKELIALACEEYKVDPNLCIAIARLETGNFTSAVFKNCNNLGGMRNDYGYYEYRTLVEGCNAFVRMIRCEYIDKGYDNVDKMANKYSESPDWANKVKQLIKESNNE